MSMLYYRSNGSLASSKYMYFERNLYHRDDVNNRFALVAHTKNQKEKKNADETAKTQHEKKSQKTRTQKAKRRSAKLVAVSERRGSKFVCWNLGVALGPKHRCFTLYWP